MNNATGNSPNELPNNSSALPPSANLLVRRLGSNPNEPHVVLWYYGPNHNGGFELAGTDQVSVLSGTRVHLQMMGNEQYTFRAVNPVTSDLSPATQHEAVKVEPQSNGVLYLTFNFLPKWVKDGLHQMSVPGLTFHAQKADGTPVIIDPTFIINP